MSLTLCIVRHGERRDHVEPSFLYTSPTPFDPPLTPRGIRQAKQTGSYIYTLQQESISNDTQRNVEYIITTSPFVRTFETSIGIAEGILASEPPNSKVKFRIDSSLAEWHTSAYFNQAVPNTIISKRFEELHERSGKDDSYPFEIDFSYKPILSELPKYPEGIHEVLNRCKKALEEISSPFIQQIKQDRLSENTKKLKNTDVVLIIVTHGWCFNVIQEACSKSAGWKEAGFCAVSRAKWVPIEDSQDVEGGGIPDITISNTDVDDEIEKKNETVNSLNAVNPNGKWVIDIIAATDHIRGI